MQYKRWDEHVSERTEVGKKGDDGKLNVIDLWMLDGKLWMVNSIIDR
jgi:hypothetical protein